MEHCVQKIKQNRDNMDFKKKIDNKNIRESIHRKIFNSNNKNTVFLSQKKVFSGDKSSLEKNNKNRITRFL